MDYLSPSWLNLSRQTCDQARHFVSRLSSLCAVSLDRVLFHAKHQDQPGDPRRFTRNALLCAVSVASWGGGEVESNISCLGMTRVKLVAAFGFYAWLRITRSGLQIPDVLAKIATA